MLGIYQRWPWYSQAKTILAAYIISDSASNLPDTHTLLVVLEAEPSCSLCDSYCVSYFPHE